MSRGFSLLPLSSASCQSSRGVSCQQAWAISMETSLVILCLRWLAKSTCVCESTLFMMVFGIQPCTRHRGKQRQTEAWCLNIMFAFSSLVVITHTFRSILSNQVNLVLFGSSAQGFITIQVGPFSALKKCDKRFENILKPNPGLGSQFHPWPTW